MPGPVQRDNNNWAPRVGLRLDADAGPAGFSRWLFGGKGRASIRGGYGIELRRALLQHPHRERVNYPRVVVPRVDNVFDVYPNLAAGERRAVFNPLAQYVNTPVDAQYPRDATTGRCRGA